MTKKLALLAVFLPLLAFAPRAAAAQMNVQTGYDHSGGDYTSFPAGDAYECQRACEREGRCRAFTLLRSAGTCYLKDNVYPLRRNGDAVTGSKERGGAYPPGPGLGGDLVREPGYDRRGDDYATFRTRGDGECARLCASDGRCLAYTYLFSNGTCYLKGRVNSRFYNRDAVTGYKESVPTPIPPRPPIGGLTKEWNTDRPGYDYTNFAVAGARECRDACANDGRCRAYTFLKRYSRCYLKSGISNPRPQNDAVSGAKGGWNPGGPDTSKRTGWDHVGGDYRSFGVAGVDSCQRACQSDGRCRAWTYLRSSRMCYLKNAIYDPQVNRDAVTGIKGY
ncbi:MAG TPA: PAN/Apple domain-containing protein [Thermoanaerobaculia bacterium]